VVLSLTWVILGGGDGARLGGVDKPLLQLADGTTFLERALLAAGEGAVVLAPLAKQAALREVAPNAIYLDDPGEGPAVALGLAAAQLDSEWIVLWAADHPHPSSALVARLAALAEGHDGAIVVTEQDQPIPGVYRRTAVLRACDPSVRSLKALLAHLSVARIDRAVLDPAERAALEDVDLPEDLLRLGARLAPRPGPLKD
jgi:molybdopterin-guanine dinucleotide biosynthesis protein A